MECFYPFGLSRLGHGVNGHQQKAINSDVIYGLTLLDQQSRSSAKMYLLLILHLLFSFQASVCVLVLITHPHQQPSSPARCAGAWLLPNPLPPACCMTFNRLIEHIYTHLHFRGVVESQLCIGSGVCIFSIRFSISFEKQSF